MVARSLTRVGLCRESIGPPIIVKLRGTASPRDAINETAASTGTFGASRAHVTSTGTDLLFSWVTDDNLWIRTGTTAGVLNAETKVLDATGTQTIEGDLDASGNLVISFVAEYDVHLDGSIDFDTTERIELTGTLPRQP